MKHFILTYGGKQYGDLWEAPDGATAIKDAMHDRGSSRSVWKEWKAREVPVALSHYTSNLNKDSSQ